MASTLDGGAGKDRNVTKGHGTGALGPSDRSDTGSDVVGGPGTFEGDVIGLDESGTTSDASLGGSSAGPDMGDSDLDSDTDSSGTGERRAAGRDEKQPGDRDRDTDQVRKSPDGGDTLEGSTSSGLATDRSAGTTDSGRSGGAT